MPIRYELTISSRPVATWRITGPGVEFRGEQHRGHLTRPPLEICDVEGAVKALLGGNRRIAPTRHELTTPDGGLRVTFGTGLVASVVESRHSVAIDAEGGELCTLVPVETQVEGVRDTLLAALSGGYFLTRDGDTIGRLGAVPDHGTTDRLAARAADLGRQAVQRMRGHTTEHVSGVLESDAELHPLLAAALLLYKRSVLDPARVPES